MDKATKTYDKHRLIQLNDQLITARVQIAALQAEIATLEETCRSNYDAGYSDGYNDAEHAARAEMNR
jgi:hypothetical protein